MYKHSEKQYAWIKLVLLYINTRGELLLLHNPFPTKKCDHIVYRYSK